MKNSLLPWMTSEDRWCSVSRVAFLLSCLCGILVASAVEAGEEDNQLQLVEVTQEAGIEFRHCSPITPRKHLHLFMGSGIAWIDYDADGWSDLYVCQGQPWGEGDASSETVTDRLYRNCGDGTFRDVTEQSGVKNRGYSMGVAVGDFNNDGFPDLHVSRFGKNQLYRNRGDGTFIDVTSPSGTANDLYGASCTWGDVDGDGLLDLFLVNYLQFDPDDYPICRSSEGDKEVYAGCHPRFLEGEKDFLFLNQGDGRFEDASRQAGLRNRPSRQGLGIVALDLDDDFDLDFYVANDSVPNQLWRNDGQGDLVDEALLSGVGVNRSGIHEAGMGIAAGDYNRDGLCDLFVTNFFEETNTLYRNDRLYFTDVTAEVGLATPSRRKLGFGTNFLDLDNDGWLDLFVANGHIHNHYAEIGRDEPFLQEPQLFSNQRGELFADVSATVGDYFATKTLGRGSACADYNHDGRIDLVVSQLNRPIALLRNESRNSHHYLSLRLIGTSCNRDAIGARISVVTENEPQSFWKTGSSSYLSNDESALHVGLGPAEQVGEVKVYWPSGRVEIWKDLAADRQHELVEGAGRSAQ